MVNDFIPVANILNVKIQKQVAAKQPTDIARLNPRPKIESQDQTEPNRVDGVTKGEVFVTLQLNAGALRPVQICS